jgi:uncharacterized protein YbcV (DUF1398 family)
VQPYFIKRRFALEDHIIEHKPNNTMDSTLRKEIHLVWDSVHTPSGLTFPQTVAALLKLGVQKYHVDYVASTATAYAGSEVDVCEIPRHAPASGQPAPWNADGVVAAIREVQAGKVSYPEFSRLAMAAGVTNYFAFLEGKRVVYIGALGDLHTEWFPGSKPADERD